MGEVGTMPFVVFSPATFSPKLKYCTTWPSYHPRVSPVPEVSPSARKLAVDLSGTIGQLTSMSVDCRAYPEAITAAALVSVFATYEAGTATATTCQKSL